MSPENFCYWLQGYLELGGGAANLDMHQLDIVRKHLALVLTRVVVLDSTAVPDDVADEIRKSTPSFPHSPRAC